MDTETVTEKIKNKLTPIVNLVTLLEDERQAPEKAVGLIRKLNILKIVRHNCDYLIRLGEGVDGHLPKGFDYSKLITTTL